LGYVAGVKYDRIGVLLINTIKEQQAEIERQALELRQQKALNTKALERLGAVVRAICRLDRNAEVCGN
jgi:hypothetical protein